MAHCTIWNRSSTHWHEDVSRPALRTERLDLEPLTAEHTEDLVALDSDPEVMRFLSGRASTRDEVLDIWMPRRTDPDHDRRGLGYWVALRGGIFLGWFCLTPRPEAGTAELGYRLRRDAWGPGYAVEGARAIVDHGFDTVGLRRIVADTMAVNTASRRVMERLGMQHVRTEIREWDEPLPGTNLGEVVYELTKR